MELATLVKKFILSKPFISFDDIYDPSTDPKKNIKANILEIFERSKRSGKKAILLYGPKGSGKTLVVHALAKHIGGIVAQIEDISFIKIKYFVTEFGRCCSEYIKTPVVVFVKNADALVYNALSELLFLLDKFNDSKKNIVFVVSSSIPPQNLPKQLKFTYIQMINSVNQRFKYGLFKYFTDKFGITISSMSEQDLMNFVYQNFRNYSNFDVFQVIKTCLDMKKQSGGSLNYVDRDTLERALRNVPGTLSPQIIQFYNL
jgi:SpoVK/Ycf46/Vps4 family AAA+-type ATPase